MSDDVDEGDGDRDITGEFVLSGELGESGGVVKGEDAVGSELTLRDLVRGARVLSCPFLGS